VEALKRQGRKVHAQALILAVLATGAALLLPL
jgi:hypothetical protein